MATDLFENLLRENPKVPVWNDIDPTQVQADTLAGNLANFDEANKLADKYDAAAAAQVQARLKALFPQFSELQDEGAKVISDRLKGILSTSDVAASQRSSAARALGLGVGGSPFGAGLTLYDIGKRQYQSQNEGLAMLPGYVSTVMGATRAPMFDIGSMFLSPQQRWQMTFQNQSAKWNQQWLKNQIDAQPTGWAWALAKQGDEDIDMAKQAAVSYFGGGIGGGMGGGGDGYGRSATGNTPVYNFGL